MKIISYTFFYFLLMIMTWPVHSDQNDPRLAGLFQRLQTTENPRMAQLISEDIWNIWSRSDNKEIDALFHRGEVALQNEDAQNAHEIFDQIIERSPDFAEAWNKRATAHYQSGHYPEALSDLEVTLTLEPRHFGALTGQGMCYLKMNEWKPAINAFDKALKLNPWLAKIRAKRKELRKIMEYSI